jgi:hypothetical protein
MLKYYETTEIRQIAEQVRRTFGDSSNIPDVSAGIAMINKAGWKVQDADDKRCYVVLAPAEISMVLDLVYSKEA